MASFLGNFTIEIIEGKVLRRRLHFDKATWERKYQQITDQVQMTMNAFREVHHNFEAALSSPVLDLAQAAYSASALGAALTIEMTVAALRQRVQAAANSMVDTHDLLVRDLQHTSHLIVSYCRQKPSERRLLYSRYMAPLRQRIETLADNLTKLMPVLQQDLGNAQGHFEAQLRTKWQTGLAGAANTIPARLANIEAAQVALEEAARDVRRLTVGFAASITKLSELNGMLHPDYIGEPPTPDPHGWLDSVRAARRTRTESDEVRRAALHGIKRSASPTLRAMICAWLRCIRAYCYQSRIRGIGRKALRDQQHNARNQYLEQLARVYVENQISDYNLQPGDAGTQVYEGTLQWIKDQIATDPDVSLAQDELTRVVNDLGTGTVPHAPYNNLRDLLGAGDGGRALGML